MSFWRRLLRRFGKVEGAQPPAPEDHPEERGTIPLPTEPFVFECRDCGKVFEVRRRRATCPECDSENVEILSE